jgi:soluble lytic murein transglycosylase
MRGSPLLILITILTTTSCATRTVPGPGPSRVLVDSRVESVRDFLATRPTGLTPVQLLDVSRAIVAEADRTGVTPGLVASVIHVESSGRNFARSRVGALGLMQLLPGTGEDVAGRAGVDWQGPSTLFDPVANVRLGVTYLDELIGRFGDVELALAAYNWGPTRISQMMTRGRPVPTGYARRVMRYYERDAYRIGLG